MSKLLFPAYPLMAHQQAGWTRARMLMTMALVLLLIIFSSQLRGCIDNPPDWFPGKNKTELKVENQDLRNQIEAAIDVNIKNQEQRETKEAVDVIVDNTVKEQKAKTEVVVAKVEKVKTKTKEKIKVIEKDPELTEQQKDTAVIAAAADSIWDSYCTIQPTGAGCPS